MIRSVLLFATLATFAQSLAAAPAAVNESARRIPVAYDVDVVIVGGSTGAVAAAEAAAANGAKVFLAAPRPYLGEDMCATMRLWPEEGETAATPLARKVFADPVGVAASGGMKSLPFKYSADLPSSSKHKDSTPPKKLCDGAYANAATESVQYDGDVILTADLGREQHIAQAAIALFRREGEFDPASVTIQTSADGKQWSEAVTINCTDGIGETLTPSVKVGAKIRYAKFIVRRTANSNRLLVGELFLSPDESTATAQRRPVRPMHVKKTLDEALLAANVPFLFGCFASDVLRDAEGKIAGIVIANRNGRQAVRAKVVIDATARGTVARLAGAQFSAYPAGNQTFQYYVVGGEAKEGEGVASRKTGASYGAGAEIIEYTLSIPMVDASFAAFANAEQIARDRVYSDTWLYNTDELFQVPPDTMKGQAAITAAWAGVEKLNLAAFKPAGVDRLYVLGGCADLPRDQAAKVLRPAVLMELGARIGAAAAAEAKAAPAIAGASLSGQKPADAPNGEVKESLAGIRPMQKNIPTVSTSDRPLPILGSYDVVVVGGGTGGAPAGISAARNQTRTLVIEYLHGMGGVGTWGLIAKYYWGYRDGFTAELPGVKQGWSPIQKSEWYRAAARKAGADIWYGTVGCGAFVDYGTVKGVVVATPEGRGIVLAKQVIDATGNADIAAPAGALTQHTDASEIAQQGTGLPPMKLGAGYTNTDFTLVDETDLVDVWHVLVYAKSKYAKAFDLGQLIDTRERRRIIGEFTMTLADAINSRTYPDTIAVAWSNFDTHGYTVDPYLLLDHPEKKGVMVHVPYRCLLPKGLDGILVTGLDLSVHRDALPLVRMQPDTQNRGYAAGLIAATAAREGIALRAVNLREIQKTLAAMKIIPESALKDEDSYPLPAEKIAAAVAQAKEGHGLPIIMTHIPQAMPLLKQAYASATGDKDKLAYARILAVLGDASGVETLIATLEAAPKWDKGWNYTGMGQFGNSLSEVDRLIIALGRTRDRRALPAILKKVAQLDATSEFSHHRAVALALESIGDPSAAKPLADLLKKPGLRGYVVTNIATAAEQTGANPNDNSTRSTSLRELSLARALFRCGDCEGLGRQILTEYASDLRGHWARHAQAVLDEKK